MRATGARAEPDPVDQFDLETGTGAGRFARSGPPPAAARAAPPHGPHLLRSTTLVSIVVALGVGIYGIETDAKSVALVGLAFTALVAVVMAVRAGTAIRANERLQRRNADLQTFQLAVVQGFDWIDERTKGRLKELVEEAGDELAALVEDALDDPTEAA